MVQAPLPAICCCIEEDMQAIPPREAVYLGIDMKLYLRIAARMRRRLLMGFGRAWEYRGFANLIQVSYTQGMGVIEHTPSPRALEANQGFWVHKFHKVA